MYRTIDAAIWSDQKVRKLNPSERLLFIYFITNPHTHVSGIYYLPDLIAQHETGLTAKQLSSGSDTLSRLGFCRFDPLNELVWVVKMFRYQGNGQKNTLSAAHHLSKDIHNSFLISEFLVVYPEVAPFIKNTVSVDATPNPIPEPDPNPKNGTETGKGDRGKPDPVIVRIKVEDNHELGAPLPDDFLQRLSDLARDKAMGRK